MACGAQDINKPFIIRTGTHIGISITFNILRFQPRKVRIKLFIVVFSTTFSQRHLKTKTEKSMEHQNLIVESKKGSHMIILLVYFSREK